jgi:hypothetical protein
MPAKASVTHETAGHWNGLPDVAYDGDRYEIEAADAAIGRIESDPACARDKSFCPCVGRSRITQSDALLIGIVEITRDDTRAEPEAARRVRKEYREIPTRSQPLSTVWVGD